MSRGAQSYNCEDYLLVIDELIAVKGYARVCEIAEKLRVQSASVSGMVLRLHRKGWVARRPRYAVMLTESGRRMAGHLRRRRLLLRRLFEKVGVKSSDATRELHALERVVSGKTCKAIQQWLTITG